MNLECYLVYPSKKKKKEEKKQAACSSCVIITIIIIRFCWNISVAECNRTRIHDSDGKVVWQIFSHKPEC